MGTVQIVVETLQKAYSAVKVLPSLWRIATVYPVIAEPPLVDGADQMIVTLVFELTDVIGAAGTLGLAAALTFTSEESVPKPTKVRAVILKV